MTRILGIFFTNCSKRAKQDPIRGTAGFPAYRLPARPVLFCVIWPDGFPSGGRRLLAIQVRTTSILFEEASLHEDNLGLALNGFVKMNLIPLL